MTYVQTVTTQLVYRFNWLGHRAQDEVLIGAVVIHSP
jgi:hypothetical protein